MVIRKMSRVEDEAAESLGKAIAAAVEAGWSRETFDDVVDSIWTDVQKAYAVFIVREALAKARR
jgi:hypothetical protein